MKPNKKLVFFLALFLMVSSVVPFLCTKHVEANPAWLTGWGYRQQHNMTGAAGAGTNYQIYLNVYRGAGASAGNSIYLNNHNSSTFPYDLNFTDNDETTPLHYWVENSNSSWAGVWVEVADDLSAGTVPIYVYYGKSGVASASSGANTFMTFDDFSGDLSAYTQNPAGKWSILAGDLCLYEIFASSGDQIYKTSTPSTNTTYAVRAKMKWTQGTTTYMGLMGRHTGTGDFYLFQGANSADKINLYKCVGAAWTQLGADVAYTIATGTWYIFELEMSGTTIKASVDNAEQFSQVDNAHTNGTLGVRSGTVVNGGEVDDLLTRKYVSPEPTHGAWGSEESLLSIGASAGTNWDDADNCYAQKKTYTVSVTYSDTGGFANIHYCELYLKTGGNTTRATFQFHEDDASWSTPAGSTEWTLTGQSNSSSGNNIAVVWGFQAQWDATEESDLDFLFFMINSAGSSTNSVTDENFDVVTRLVTTGFTNDDSRINIAGTTTISGTVYYGNDPASNTASASYPQDAEFTGVSIHNSTHTSQSTDNTIINGAFSVSFSIPSTVQSNTYHAYINLADADGTDQDTVDGDTTTVVGDRVNVYSFQSNDTRTNVNEYVNITAKAELEYDHHALGAGDSVSFNATSMVWNGVSFYNDTHTQAVTGNWTLAIDGATEATYTITAYTTNVTDPWVVWDNLTATNLQPVQYQGAGAYKYDVQLTYGFDGTSVAGGYVGLEYPNGTKAGECVTNATGYASFVLDQLNATNGVLRLYGLNETAYDITVAGLNQTFAIRLWTLAPQDVSGNILTNTDHNVTLGASAVWNGTATGLYVPPDTFNVTVSWLQNLVVNSTINVVIAGDTTTDLNCTCYPYVIGATRYWTASNATIASATYAGSLLNVTFSSPVNTYILVASYTTRPSYIVGAAYNYTVDFVAGYLVIAHYANMSLTVSYENWGGLYVAVSDRLVISAGWSSYTLLIVTNGTAGDIGLIDVYCGVRGSPVSTSGFTLTSYAGSTFSGTYVFSSPATLSLEWSVASGPGGPSGAVGVTGTGVFVTFTVTFPENVQNGQTTEGILKVTWSGAARIYLYGVTLPQEYRNDWLLIVYGLPICLNTTKESGVAEILVELQVSSNVSQGTYTLPCTATFITVEGTSKAISNPTSLAVVNPMTEVPNVLVYVFLLMLGTVMTGGLFMESRRKKRLYT